MFHLFACLAAGSILAFAFTGETALLLVAAVGVLAAAGVEIWRVLCK